MTKEENQMTYLKSYHLSSTIDQFLNIKQFFELHNYSSETIFSLLLIEN